MISDYNVREPYHLKNVLQIFARQLHIHGFIFAALSHKYIERFYAEMPQRIKSGEIKWAEDVSEGLDRVPEAIVDVQTGRTRGKKVVVVARG